MSTTIYIKNMVCPRCIHAVRQIFAELDLPIVTIQLGAVEVAPSITVQQRSQLLQKLQQLGFALLDSRQMQTVNAIKSIIIENIHHQNERTAVNYSTLLADKLHGDYANLSRLFSAVENRTIEQFVIAQKIERVKELLSYEEFTLAEIAFQMQYSSAAYLSSQFKKVTGLTPSSFRQLVQQQRKPLDRV